MRMTRRILSNLSVINVALVAVLIAFATYAVPPLMSKSVKLGLPAPKIQPTKPAAATDKPVEGKSPSPADYFLIAEQNIFHPERKIPVEKKDVAQPLPTPEFVLYGTLLVDDVNIAYMEDKKAPQNTPTRGKKQIPLRPGESLSGFILKDISADKVVMVRGEEKLVVSLNDSVASKDRGGAAAGTPTVAQAAGAHQGEQPSTTPEAARGRRSRRAEPNAAAGAAQQNPASPDQTKAANQLLNVLKSRPGNAPPKP